jgi:hypothetical protein
MRRLQKFRFDNLENELKVLANRFLDNQFIIDDLLEERKKNSHQSLKYIYSPTLPSTSNLITEA